MMAISDNPHTLTGLALAGVQGKQVHTPEEMQHALTHAPPCVGVIIITAALAFRCAEVLDRYREKHTLPLITIIPEANP